MGIWTPSNKFEGDIAIKMEMLQIDLRREEMDLARTEYELGEVEALIEVHYNNVDYLRKKAKRVSIREYAAIKAEIPVLLNRRTSLNAEVAQRRQMVNGLKLSLDNLSQKLNKSRFKLLEFKRRER